MSITTWTIISGLLLVVYTLSFIQYMKQRSARKRNNSRIFQLPLFAAFLIGPLLFFIINNQQRREKRSFMENKNRFS
jgi:preprotein translocase subunit YajC